MQKILTHLKSAHTGPLAGLLLADGIVFGMTDPRTVPSLVLMIGFLLLTATSYYLCRGMLAIFSLYGVPIWHKRRLLRTLTIVTGSLTALQSIGQLNSRDIVVISMLTVLFYLYLSSAKSLRQNLQAKQS